MAEKAETSNTSLSEDLSATGPKINDAPLVTIIHASVGSGHKAAANAIAQAFELLKGENGIPENVRVEVLDILDFGRIVYGSNASHLRSNVALYLNGTSALGRRNGLDAHHVPSL